MNIRLIGDIHCQNQYKYLMEPWSIQLGDLCVCGYEKFSFDKDPRFFVPGNHEYWPILPLLEPKIKKVSENLYAFPRGYVCGNVLMISGAYSIDKSQRIYGEDWWPEEELYQEQTDEILKIDRKIEVILSHTAPEFLFDFNSSIPEEYNHMYQLSRIFDRFMPKLWVFGHHHRNIDITKYDCRFVGLGINVCERFDLPLDINQLKEQI